MKNIPIKFSAIAILVLLSIASRGQKTHARADTASKHEHKLETLDRSDIANHISHMLQIKGAIERTLELNVDSIKQMKLATLDSNAFPSRSGGSSEIKTCKGVLLRDLLNKAGIKQADHKDRGYYFVARATDGYKAIFSWGEIFNNSTGDRTYIIVEKNGSPILEKGEFELICINDLKPGPRHVYWLSSIEVFHID